MKKHFLLLLLIPLLVLLLAAVHPTHILRTPASQPAPDAFKQTVPLTRIFRAPAALLETGLELPDLISNMTFDSNGLLWMSSTEGGPYLYSIETNEMTNLVFPDSVFGLFRSQEGIWVLTKEKASVISG